MSSQQPAPNYDNYAQNYNYRPQQQYSNPLLQQTQLETTPIMAPISALTSTAVSSPEISIPNSSNVNELLNLVTEVKQPQPPRTPQPIKNNDNPLIEIVKPTPLLTPQTSQISKPSPPPPRIINNELLQMLDGGDKIISKTDAVLSEALSSVSRPLPAGILAGLTVKASLKASKDRVLSETVPVQKDKKDKECNVIIKTPL